MTDVDRLPVLDMASLARHAFDDRELQRDLLALFEAQCDRLLADLGRPSGAEVAFAAHTLKGAANAIGAARVAALADRLEDAVRSGTQPAGPAGLVVRLRAAIAEARVAIAGELRDA